MRIAIALLLALLLVPPTFVQAQDGYGQRLCSQNMAGAPCACVGPILEEEFEEEELEPLLTFMKVFLEGLKAGFSGGDTSAAQKRIDALTAKHGQAHLEALMKRYTPVDANIQKTCMWTW